MLHHPHLSSSSTAAPTSPRVAPRKGMFSFKKQKAKGAHLDPRSVDALPASECAGGLRACLVRARVCARACACARGVCGRGRRGTPPAAWAMSATLGSSRVRCTACTPAPVCSVPGHACGQLAHNPARPPRPQPLPWCSMTAWRGLWAPSGSWGPRTGAFHLRGDVFCGSRRPTCRTRTRCARATAMVMAVAVGPWECVQPACPLAAAQSLMRMRARVRVPGVREPALPCPPSHPHPPTHTPTHTTHTNARYPAPPARAGALWGGGRVFH